MATTKCLCGCGRIARSRQLSRVCYMPLFLAVQRGETTWAQLEQEGRSAPTLSRQAKSRRVLGDIVRPTQEKT